MGGSSQQPHNILGELALLLDTLDLILHSKAASHAPADSPHTRMDDSGSADLDQQTDKCAESPQCGGSAQPVSQTDKSGVSPQLTTAAQSVSQTDKYADTMLWGLKALGAVAKQGVLNQPLERMLTDYLLECIVMLSGDWPVQVGQASAEVSMHHNSGHAGRHITSLIIVNVSMFKANTFALPLAFICIAAAHIDI